MSAVQYLMRNPSHVVLTGRNSVFFIGTSGAPARVSVERPADWSRFLQDLAGPSPRHAVVPPPEFDDPLLERLVAEEHLLADRTPEMLLKHRDECMAACPAFHLSPPADMVGHLLLGCTGSVISGLIPQTILSLVLAGFQQQLDVILSETAQRFLTRDLLESYGVRCWSDGFERQDGLRVPHVNLAKSAGIICVLPATAHCMDRVARSACSDLLSLTITASRAPVLICPAMNEAMWSNPGVQRNAERLRGDGRYIMEPTVLIAAADFKAGAPLGYGGHGTLWAGPGALMQTLSAIVSHGEGARM